MAPLSKARAKCPIRPSGITKRLGRLSFVFLLMLFVAGCNTTEIFQDDGYNPPVYWGRHVVKSGETLYSIAWRYGRDYRELGNANGIKPPYQVKAGRVLRLDLRGSEPSGRSPYVASQPSQPIAKPTRKVTPARAPRVEKAPVRSQPLPEQRQTVSGIEWRWPHVGTVLAGFSTSGKVNKGVDIAGNSGDPIRAAASGNVVYAGNGLLGYGNLIIVNHNENFLSAYAHNRKILVNEGESVKAGQTIAELGSSGTDRSKLHFEIRRDGNPVDPMPYLPPR
nr:peptidoglycan DD-metalloendopeptidase family protein [Marinobacter caseinilyticus]